MKQLKIFIVNLDFPPIGGPGVWRVLSLAKYLAKLDHQVTVFCSDRSSWHNRTDTTLLDQLPTSITIYRVKSIFLKDILEKIDRLIERNSTETIDNVLKALRWRIAAYWPNPVLFWSIKTTWKSLFKAMQIKPDCIITSGPQHLSHLAGYISKRLFGVPWIMDYRDPWTTPPTDSSVNETNSRRYRFGQRLERHLNKYANRVTVVSPSWLNEISQTFDRKCIYKYSLIRNGHDLPPDTCNYHRKSTHGPLRIHFNGMLAPGSADIFSCILLAIDELVVRGVDSKRVNFSFCGIPEMLQNRAKKYLELGFIVDLGALSHSDSIKICQQSDALLVTMSSDPAFIGAIPGKLYEAIALGSHILAIVSSTSDVRGTLKDYPYASFADSGDVESIKSTIHNLLHTYEKNNQLPMPNSQCRKENAMSYSRQSQTDEFLQLIRKECN